MKFCRKIFYLSVPNVLFNFPRKKFLLLLTCRINILFLSFYKLEAKFSIYTSVWFSCGIVALPSPPKGMNRFQHDFCESFIVAVFRYALLQSVKLFSDILLLNDIVSSFSTLLSCVLIFCVLWGGVCN